MFWGGGKIILLCDERKHGGGGPSKTIFKKSPKKSKSTKIKKSTRNLKVGACGFNLYYYDPDYLLKHISSSSLSPLPPNKSSLSQPKFYGKLYGGTGSHWYI